jgi:hypothetical protein
MTAPPAETGTYGMAPLIRITLLALYLALVLPLPSLAPPAVQLVLWGCVALGLLVMVALTSERVVVDADGVRVAHPPWCGWCLRRGWALRWPEVAGLTPVATSQGGRVFYVRAKLNPSQGSGGRGQAYLLPQRVERFEAFLSQFTTYSGVSTAEVMRISPPWTYQLLAAMSVAMLAGELVVWINSSGSH